MRAGIFVGVLLAVHGAAWAGAGEGVEEFHALFMKIDLGGQLMPDAPKYEATYYSGYSSSEANPLSARVSFGYQSPYILGLQAGFNFVSLYTANMGTLYFVGPTLRQPMPGLGGRPLIHSLDVNYEAIYLPEGYTKYSSTDYDYLAGGIVGGYSISYGLEQMFGRRFSIGLKAGYLFATANVLGESYRYSAVYPYSSYAITHTDVNLSGPRFALSLNFWPKQPYLTPKDHEETRAKEKRRQERLRERLGLNYMVVAPPAEAASDPNDLPFSSAREALSWGDHHLQGQRYAQAASAYRSATKLDPFSPRVWRSLGKAEYMAGRHIASLRAYERASDLQPEDQALKDFVAKLKAKLGADDPR